MKKLIALGMAIVLLLSLGVGGAFAADNNPNASAKATAQVKDVTILDWSESDVDWTNVLTQTIKTANKKDLFIDVSLECGLYTKTKAKSKDFEVGTATATAAIDVRVLVDGEPASPSDVTFNARTQTLTVKFAGLFDEGTETWTEEEVELILDTMSANSFNFVIADLSSGVHTVTVQAKIDTDVDGIAEAKATIGNGSVTIEEVRMIKGEEWLID
jgi:hypothetical protein